MAMNEPEQQHTSPVVALIGKATRLFAVVMGVMLLPILLFTAWQWWQSYRTLDWAAVDGRIVEGGHYAPKGQDDDRAVVEYVLDGKRYRHLVRYRVGREELGVESLENLRRYAHGAKVEVYYDPGEEPELVDPESGLFVRYRTVLKPGFEPDAWEEVFVLAGFSAAIALFWFIPGLLLARVERRLRLAQNDPSKRVVGVSAQTRTGSYSHVEIHSRSDEPKESMVSEDGYGRVLFDSTQRPIRLLFGGFFLLVGWGIGAFMYFASNEVGVFEYVFVAGWSGLALAAMGLVYEVTLNRREDIVDKRYGWFFLVRKQRCRLHDFDRIVVETRFHRHSHGGGSERMHRREPSFSVDLGGDRRLNLRVFSNLSDAERLAEELSAYLNLPVARDEQVLP